MNKKDMWIDKITKCKGDKGYRIEHFELDDYIEITVMNRNNSMKYSVCTHYLGILSEVLNECNNSLGGLVSFSSNSKDLNEIIKKHYLDTRVVYKEI